MRVYLTAPSGGIDELDHYADSLRWAGHEVEVGQPGDGGERADTVSRADVVICLLSDSSPDVGGSAVEVELGLVLAWSKHILLVGPRGLEDHPDGHVQHFQRWGRCLLDALEEMW